ncbi:adenylate kinase [Spirulina sp. 06S082]|uniref:adenylate kinase n=1 Tax=Spirulina sp. 06S082 TaxID=3110248 RepID=UPI002B1FC641|nr:adenylate kinase [Spirulina sp. 06S082]MEA5470205.1 adenylate kinase [Spirulina sp. 06S082]
MTYQLIFLGPPGAGKGTQAQLLAETVNIPHISTGDILRGAIANNTPLGQQAKSYMDKGDLVPDALVSDLVRERLQEPDAEKGWILDGFPRTVEQASFLNRLLSQGQENSLRVLNLEVPEQVLIDRLMARGRSQDDNLETIRNRLVVYQQKTAPLIDYYQKQGNLHSVNGDRELEEIRTALQAILEI